MKKMILRWACFFLTLCTMAMIFYFSSENGKESGAASEGVTAFLVRLFSGKEMSELSEKALATISLFVLHMPPLTSAISFLSRADPEAYAM